jgi:hypothetical protein
MTDLILVNESPILKLEKKDVTLQLVTQEVNINFNAVVVQGGSGGNQDVMLQSKDVTITENGTTRVVPDEDYKGMNEVNVSVEVYDNFAVSYQEDTQTVVITSPQYIETADNRRF